MDAPYGTVRNSKEKENRTAEREGAGRFWTADVGCFRGSGDLSRDKAFVRETSSERKIECTRVEDEISSCNFFFFIVKFACPVETSFFVADPSILIIFYFILFFFLLHRVVLKRF